MSKFNPSAPREEDTEYNGFLSYAVEWHSLAIGIGAGLAGSLLYTAGYTEIGVILPAIVVMIALGVEIEKTRTGRGIRVPKETVRNVSREPWYASGGVVIGYIAGVLISLVF